MQEKWFKNTKITYLHLGYQCLNKYYPNTMSYFLSNHNLEASMPNSI